MTLSTATINYAPPSLTGPQKFKKQPGEAVLHKGNLSYTVGEAGIRNLFNGKFQVTECTVFLTNHRFVATKARQYFPWGPLVWLIMALIARKILFSIPLSDIAAIQLDPKVKAKLTLQTTSGAEFTLVSGTLFNSQPKWVAALSEAIKAAAPGTTSQQSETEIKFARA
jgi:hypothetical protein